MADDCGPQSRRPARKLLTPGPPTVQLLHPIGSEVPDDRHVQQVSDLCIRIGEVLLSSGEGSGETTETVLRVADAFGLAAVDVDVTFTAITMCCHRGMAAIPITSMRLVTHRGRSGWHSRRRHPRAVPHPAAGDPAVPVGPGAARRPRSLIHGTRLRLSGLPDSESGGKS